MHRNEPEQRIHQARLSLFPTIGSPFASYTFSTVEYTRGGRIPQIHTQESGRLVMPANPSPWACAEALQDVLRQMLGS